MSEKNIGPDAHRFRNLAIDFCESYLGFECHIRKDDCDKAVFAGHGKTKEAALVDALDWIIDRGEQCPVLVKIVGDKGGRLDAMDSVFMGLADCLKRISKIERQMDVALRELKGEKNDDRKRAYRRTGRYG
jgi:hypothetical protein